MIESFNGRLRDEFLNVNEFVTMHDAREKLKVWQDDYNTCRPHGSLGHLTPSEFVKMWSGQPRRSGQPLIQNCPNTGETSGSRLPQSPTVH